MVFSTSASAFSISNVNDSQSLINGSPYYNSANDEIRVDYYGTRIVKTGWSFVESGTGRTFSKDFTAPSGKWYVAAGFTCVGTYTYTGSDSVGNTLVSYTLTVNEGDLNSPKCESTDEDGTGSEPIETDCWTEVCKCIADLKQPINNISDTVNTQISQTNQKLDTVNSNLNTTNSHLSDLKEVSGQIRDEVISLHDEFQTDKNYELDPVPDISNLLDENRPVENTVPFKDETIYFKDEGDAPDSDIGPLPSAPDVKHWDGFLPEDAIPSESELSKESEKQSDKELLKEKEKSPDLEPNKDLELNKDVFNPSEQLPIESFEQSEQLPVEEFKQSDVMQKETFKQADELNKTYQFKQTNTFP